MIKMQIINKVIKLGPITHKILIQEQIKRKLIQKR